MTNTTLFANLIDRYNAVAFTHNYIWGFIYKHNVYMAIADSKVMPYICTLDQASRGGGYSLRFCPKVEQKLFLMQNAKMICSEKFFLEEVENSIYNKGEIFEKLVTEQFGQNWEKDNVPFTKGPDVIGNGVAYQVKFEKATFCNEKSIANLEN